MATKDRTEQRKKSRKVATSRDADDKSHAPAGRGGAAMGRTVGLPYGGARARKRARKTGSDEKR